MTILLERRYKCDFCGCVSPVHVSGQFPVKGWVVGKGYNYWTFPEEDDLYHFCCGSHQTLWDQQQGKETA